MTINGIMEEGILVATIEGRIDSVTSDTLETYIDVNVTDEIQGLTLDFADVDFISSKGLRVLVATKKKLGSRELLITHANSAVMEVFRLSGLLKIFKVEA